MILFIKKIGGSFFPSDNFSVQRMSDVGVTELICAPRPSHKIPVRNELEQSQQPEQIRITDTERLNFGINSRGGKMRARLGRSWFRCSGNVFDFEQRNPWEDF